jgi:hypothetical protein
MPVKLDILLIRFLALVAAAATSFQQTNHDAKITPGN